MSDTEYQEQYADKLHHLFGERADLDQIGLQRGIPPYVFQELLSAGPQLASIPESHGGRGARPHEILAVLEKTSYQSLPLGLILGINGALFLEPLAKYGQASLKDRVFPRFTGAGSLGGLMITEPDYGTDALSMQTSFTGKGPYFIKGTKHWAGLSGWADFWLVTARGQKENGSLQRDISFFVADSAQPGELIKVEEYYPNLGLYSIPYGRNKLDLELPADSKFNPINSGLRLLQDLLHRSRMRFPGLAAGFIKRMYDEALTHCRSRSVGGQTIENYDQVQLRLSEIQAGSTTAAAFCRYAARHSSISFDLVQEGMIANINKSLLSDMMQDSAQSLLQLKGAQGYRQDSVAGRGVTDSRPFQIFEGSNDVIYHQIAAAFLKFMKSASEKSLPAALKLHGLTKHSLELVSDSVKKALNIVIEQDNELPQRKQVDFGRIISRLVSLTLISDLGDSGYDHRLIRNSLELCSEQLARLSAGFLHRAVPVAVEIEHGMCRTPSWQKAL
ncbi:acyl-CoA dehydrogenase family protein [Spirochaeta dissipatitropha]